MKNNLYDVSGISSDEEHFKHLQLDNATEINILGIIYWPTIMKGHPVYFRMYLNNSFFKDYNEFLLPRINKNSRKK